MYILFIELGISLLSERGHLHYINPLRFFNSNSGLKIREIVSKKNLIKRIIDVSQIDVFKNAMTYPCLLLIEKKEEKNHEFLFTKVYDRKELAYINELRPKLISQKFIASDCGFRFLMLDSKENKILSKIENKSRGLSSMFHTSRGLPNNKVDLNGNMYRALKSTNVDKYRMKGNMVHVSTDYGYMFIDEMIILPRTVLYLKSMIKPKNIICLDRIYYLLSKYGEIDLIYYLGVINSRVTNFWFNLNYWCEKVSGNYFDLNGEQILSIVIPNCNQEDKDTIHKYVDSIIKGDNYARIALDKYLYNFYKLTQEEINIIESEEYRYL